MRFINLKKINTNLINMGTYKDSVEELKDKYIALLEEKAQGFDKYIEYKDKCKKLTEENKELKKQIAESKGNR